jgi:hypothetical protein
MVAGESEEIGRCIQAREVAAREWEEGKLMREDEDSEGRVVEWVRVLGETVLLSLSFSNCSSTQASDAGERNLLLLPLSLLLNSSAADNAR